MASRKREPLLKHVEAAQEQAKIESIRPELNYRRLPLPSKNHNSSRQYAQANHTGNSSTNNAIGASRTDHGSNLSNYTLNNQ